VNAKGGGKKVTAVESGHPIVMARPLLLVTPTKVGVQLASDGETKLDFRLRRNDDPRV
jgi:hypothetical protein